MSFTACAAPHPVEPLSRLIAVLMLFTDPYESVIMRVRMTHAGGTSEEPMYVLHADDHADCEATLNTKRAEAAVNAAAQAEHPRCRKGSRRGARASLGAQGAADEEAASEDDAAHPLRVVVERAASKRRASKLSSAQY